MLTNNKHNNRSALEPDPEDVLVLISDDGWVLYSGGRHEDLEVLSEGVGRKEFADASIYCG